VNIDKIRINRIIDIKKLLILFILFVIVYYLLNYIYIRILHQIFSDVFKPAHKVYNRALLYRLIEFHKWSHTFKPFILLILLSLTCIYTKIFKKNYFKESIIAFLIFIITLFTFNYLSRLYADKQEKENAIIYKKLIVGKWHSTNHVVGNVTIVFNKDSTGYRFTDSIKTVQKFKYLIAKGSVLAIYDYTKIQEYYNIGSLTTKTLSIKSVPFLIKNDVYESNFTRDFP
jgi:hypothetical protein